MSSTVAKSIPQSMPAVSPAVAGKGRRISWEEFKKKYLGREDGVKVVWHVFPLLEMAHVYSGEHLESMTVCKNGQVCSAAPVLPGFALTVGDALKKPAKP